MRNKGDRDRMVCDRMKTEGCVAKGVSTAPLTVVSINHENDSIHVHSPTCAAALQHN